MSHVMNLSALRAIISNLHVACRTTLCAVVPMSGVGQNLLHIRGGLFFTLKESSKSIASFFLSEWVSFKYKTVTLFDERAVL